MRILILTSLDVPKWSLYWNLSRLEQLQNQVRYLPSYQENYKKSSKQG